MRSGPLDYARRIECRTDSSGARVLEANRDQHVVWTFWSECEKAGIRERLPAERGNSASCGGRPIAHWGQIIGPGRVDRFYRPGRTGNGDLMGGITESVEQLELRTIVFGDRPEIFVECRLHELECKDDLLRPVDQHEDVAKPGRTLQALEISVESGDARAQSTIGLSDAALPPTGDRPGFGSRPPRPCPGSGRNR